MPRGSSWSWTYSRSGGNFTGEFLLLNFPINLEIWNATPKPTFESRRWVSGFDTIFFSISLSSFTDFSGEDISFDIFSLNAFHADILGLLERPKIFGWRLILFLKFKSSNFNLVLSFSLVLLHIESNEWVEINLIWNSSVKLIYILIFWFGFRIKTDQNSIHQIVRPIKILSDSSDCLLFSFLMSGFTNMRRNISIYFQNFLLFDSTCEKIKYLKSVNN